MHEEIYKLGLFNTYVFDDPEVCKQFSIRRVPGGWIHTAHEFSVFIPFNKEYEPKEEVKKVVNKFTKVKNARLEKVYSLNYPRKMGKSRGMENIKTQIKDEERLCEFETAVRNYANVCMGKENKYIKHFAYFCNKNYWVDYIDISDMEGVKSKVAPKDYSSWDSTLPENRRNDGEAGCYGDSTISKERLQVKKRSTEDAEFNL